MPSFDRVRQFILEARGFFENHKTGFAIAEAILIVVEGIQQFAALLDFLPELVSTLITVVVWLSFLVLGVLWAAHLWRRGVKWAVPLSIGVVVGLGLVYGHVAYGLFRDLDPNQVAVLEFDGPGEPGDTANALGKSLAYAFTISLDSGGELRTLDQRDLSFRTKASRLNRRSPHYRARQLGSGLHILGSFTRIGDHVMLSARLIDTRSRSIIAEGSRSGPDSELHRMTEEIAVQLLTGRMLRQGRKPLFHGTADFPGSLNDFKTYLRAEYALHRGDFQSAGRYFEEVIENNQDFAPAYFGQSVASGWSGGDEGLALEAAVNAYRHRAGLQQRDTLVLRSFALVQRGHEVGEAAHLLHQAHRRDKSDPEVNQQIGELYLYHPAHLSVHDSAIEGIDARRAARQHFQRILDRDPSHYRARFQMLRLSLLEGDRRSAKSHIGAMLAGRPDPVHRTSLEALSHFLDGRSQDLAHGMKRLDAADPEILHLTVRILMDWWHGAPWDSRASAALDRVTGYMVDRRRPTRARILGRELRITWLLASGRRRDALRELDAMDASAAKMAQLGYLAVLPIWPTPDSILRQVRDQVQAWEAPKPANPSVLEAARPAIKEYLLGHLAVRLGDLEAATAHAQRLETEHAQEVDGLRRPFEAKKLAGDLAASVHAGVARERGDLNAAASYLRRATTSTAPSTLQWLPFFDRAFERFAYAEVLRELGATSAALHWSRSITDDPFLNAFLLPAYMNQASILDSATEAGSMARRHAATLREGADPDLAGGLPPFRSAPTDLPRDGLRNAP